MYGTVLICVLSPASRLHYPLYLSHTADSAMITARMYSRSSNEHTRSHKCTLLLCPNLGAQIINNRYCTRRTKRNLFLYTVR